MRARIVVVLTVLGTVLFVLGMVDGAYTIVNAFFTMQKCNGPDGCEWILADASPVLLTALGIFLAPVWLAIVVILAPVFGVVLTIPGGILWMIAQRIEKGGLKAPVATPASVPQIR